MPTNVLVLNKSWVVTGAGEPEGQHPAPIGSLYLREEGAVGTSVYVKESGVGVMGWKALGAPAVPPTLHASTHEPGGTDVLTVAAWTDRLNDFQAPQQITANTPALTLIAATAPVDARRFDLAVAPDGGFCGIHAVTDQGLLDGSAQVDRLGNLGLSGALTATGLSTTPLNATNLTSGSVPFARVPVSAASRLLGRGAAGAGAMEEIVLGTGLTMSGTTLNASGGGANAAYTTVANVFTASPQRIQVSGEAGLELRDLSKPVNERSWWMSTVGGNLWFSACTDADGAQKLPLILHRTGNATIVGSVLVGRDTNSDSVIIGVGGALAKVHLQVAAGNDFWIGRNIVWRNGPWESDDPALSSSFLGFTSGGDLNYYTAPAGNPPAYTVRLTLQASNGELTNSGPLKVATNISSGYYLYPGAVTAPGTYQTSWYLGAHSSYGLYTNTGFYAAGPVWSASVISAGAGLFDHGRGTAIGGWIGYGAGFWGEGSVTQGGTDAVYMLIGNTCFVKYEVNATLHAAMTYVYVYLPVTVARRMDAIGFAAGPFTGTVHCYTPAGVNYVVMHRATTHPYDLSYFQAGAYTFLFQMFVQF